MTKAGVAMRGDFLRCLDKIGIPFKETFSGQMRRMVTAIGIQGDHPYSGLDPTWLTAELRANAS
ncbi:hypothetical protein CG716_21340 [Mycolicibacterium sphagni]|uniref:Uncharacterized protein n=1 Tax=Mycolicibacterium sphagni TaxID=1786 RepID=A0A255DHM3_9MYCO|nr:hypothetical protein CG716_21340 [Mycolicibacterium sphagni]